METTERKRLDSLDGLRGVAIILVLLNHIDSTYITNVFPAILQPIVSSFFSSGLNVGVAFLFILSGYLMAFIYPQPKNNLAFLQKRYTRIFPLFVTMALVMSFFKIMPQLSPILRILTVLSAAVITHVIWVHGIKKLHKPQISKAIFLGFMGLQIIAAGIYALIIMRQPAIVFNQIIPWYMREGAIALVNATLTLPFGDYVPMLDGVYWTLVCEVLFYCLYPILFVPFVQVVSKQNKAVKILFMLSLLPFFAALTQISHNIMRFSMLKLPFFMYFATGVALGYLARKNSITLQKVTKKAGFLINPLSFLAIIVLMRLSLVNASGQLYDWIVMLWAFPLTFIVASILHEGNSLARFFSSKYLIFLGTISYSIYLSHTGVVDTLHLIFRPYNLISNIFFLLLAVAITLALASILYRLLEKPYFMRSRKEQEVRPSRNISFSKLSFLIMCFLFISIFSAYQSSFNLLSFDKTFGRDVILSPHIDGTTSKISIISYPEVMLKVKSPEDKLGILAAHLTYEFQSEKKNASDDPPQQLVFQIKPSGSSEWYATSSYKPNEIGDSKMHPFGFPLIEEAKNKEFDVRLSLINLNSKENIYLNVGDGVVIRTVNQLNKKELLSHPEKLVSLLLHRALNVMRDSEARGVFLMMIPWILSLLFFNIRLMRRS